MSEVQLREITVETSEIPSGAGRSGPPSALRPIGPLSFTDARSAAQFKFFEPTWLPAGFSPVDAMVLTGEVEVVLLTYGGSKGRLTLVQGPLSQYKAGKDGVRRYAVIGSSIRSTSIAGEPGAIAELAAKQDGQPVSVNIVWENKDVLAHLLANGVALSDVEQVAASLT